MSLPTLLDAALRVALVGGALLVVAHLLAWGLRGRTAALRHALWTSALFAIVLLPIAVLVPMPTVASVPSLESWKPTNERMVDGAAESPATAPVEGLSEPLSDAGFAGREESKVASVEVGELRVPTTPPAIGATAAEPLSGRLLRLALVLWGAGFVLLVLKLLMGVVSAGRATRRARIASEDQAASFLALASEVGAPAHTRLLVSDDVTSPRTTGLLFPVVIAPAADGWHHGSGARMMLMHELAHVVRRDVATQIIGALGVALHWWNPLAWMARRAQVREAELACDDAVLRVGAAPADYADCLLESARAARCAKAPPAFQLAMAGNGGVKGRIEAALDWTRGRAPLTRSARAGAVAATLVAAACASALGTESSATSDQASNSVEDEAQRAVLVVDSKGGEGSDYATIQGAVEAAPDGALIEVRPGRYEENVRLARAVELRGAGWEQCQLISDLDASGAPALHIMRTAEAKISGIKVTLTGSSQEGSLRQGAALMIDGGDAVVVDCAVLGSPASGVAISGDGEVRVESTLIAGAAADGLTISRPAQGEGRVLVKGCAIRNNYHNEVRIGGGASRTRVEGCWISGAGWHGIRYDGCAPQIVGNRIFTNLRSGIYASGETSALVEGNVFLDTGVSCWFSCKDVIRGNTFIGDAEGGSYVGRNTAVAIIGQSQPMVRSNLVVGWPAAFGISKARGENGDPAGTWTFEGNVLWNVGEKLQRMGEPADFAEGSGNVVADPGFASAQGNFVPSRSSEAAKRGVGALAPLGSTSPWSLQEEEKAFASGPSSAAKKIANNRSQAVSRRRAQAAAETSKDWIEGATQIKDAELRTASLEKILAAIRSGTPASVDAGVFAYQRVGDVRFDRAPYAEALLMQLPSLRGSTRVSAYYGLLSSREKREPEDLKRLLTALEETPDSALRNSGTHLIMLASDGDVSGAAGEAVLALLNSDDIGPRETLPGLWGARVSEAVESRLLELGAKDARTRYDAIYYALSTLYEKGPRTVELLMGAAEGRGEAASRAIWGLSYGVGEASRAKVASFMLDMLEARNDPSTRSDCMQGLRQYATKAHAERFDELIANELISEDLRKGLTKLRGQL